MAFVSSRITLYGLLALISIIVLTGQHLLPPVDRDEPRFAQASRQMLQSGDYVTIRFQDELRAKKPVGIYWLQALSANFLGDREISSYRFVNLLALLASVFILYHIGLRLYEPAMALLASAAFSSSFLVLGEAHLAKTDTVLMLAVLVQQWALMRIYIDRNANVIKSHLDWVWFWGAMAVGILVKGPISPAIAILTVGSLVLWHRQLQWLRQVHFWRGLLLLAVICLPWAILVTLATDGVFLESALKGDFLAKVRSGQESHGAPPLTYLALFGLLLWPTSIMLPSLCVQIKTIISHDKTRFLLAWIVPFWVLIEFIPTKLLHYPLPVVPALALLLTCSVDRVLSLPPVRQRLLMIGQYLFLAFGAVLVVICGVAAMQFGGESGLMALCFVGLSFVVTGLAVWYGHCWIQNGSYLNLTTLCVIGLFTHFTIFSGVVPNLARIHVTDTVAKKLSSAKNPPAAIAAAGFHEPSLVFLLGHDVLLVDSREAALFLAEAPDGVALIEARQQAEFLGMIRRLGLTLSEPEQVSGFNISKGQDVIILIYRREMFDANSDNK